MTTSSIQRNGSPNRLPDDTFDVFVVGGGIVGAGVARDSAMRGLKTALIEQQDFGAGTSSRSSRLLHGGIRYLSQGRISLVREANKEKTVVQHIAPHLAAPLAFIFPTRRKSGWSLWKLGIGVKIYDFLCGRRKLGNSKILGRGKTLELLPGLNQERLTGAVRYYDGLTNDARLVLDTLRSATNAGAVVQNYTRFIDANRTGDRWECEVENAQTGERSTISTKSVVNATGPWSNRIPNSETDLRLTKGVHLVIDASRLSIPDAVVIAEGERILFAIPWGKRVILGTTDTDYKGPLKSPQCDSDDVAYVLQAVNDAFPQAKLIAEDVLSTWAGIRPLVADRNGNPSDISRRHEVKMSHPGWWDVTGGKLTTYRLMAEETLDSIAGFLGVSARACETAETQLLSQPDSIEVSGLLPPPVSHAAVEHFCDAEWAVHLDDVMIRRTSWRYYDRNHLSIADEVAGWMGKLLDWDEATMKDELARYRELTDGGATLAGPHFQPSSNGAAAESTTAAKINAAARK